MSKPDLETVLGIIQVRQMASEFYALVDEAVANIVAEHGPGRYDYDLHDFVDTDQFNETLQGLLEKGRYLKVEVTDNREALANGETVWKSVAFTPISFSERSLKTCPDSLKYG